MNQTILNFLNDCEKWKVEIKNFHWSAKNLSQHELCDDIASSISDFEDLVSEVEQSISGKIKLNALTPKKANETTLKEFVKGVISVSKDFLKKLEGMGEDYIGIKSECESFIGDMQRKLYLVNFTLNESMPKNLEIHDEIDKFTGRKPKTIQARINQIYRMVKKYGIDSKVYTDNHWQAIEDYYRAISSMGCDVDMKPCANLTNADSMMSDGGYCDYDKEDNMPRSKQYAITISFDDGMKISGYIKCMAAGTVEDPFARYDTCIVLWPKNNRVIENKQIKLTENELKEVIAEAAMKILSETPLNYDIDNFSGRWNKTLPGDYIDGESEGYFDDPNRKSEIESDLDDYASEEGDMRPMKDIENDYSWDRFDNKAVAPGLDDYYKVGKGAIPREVNNAIDYRKRENDWNDRELGNRNRMMTKWINGERDADQIGDAWDDIHYESKKPIKITEEELITIIKEATKKLVNEVGETESGQEKLARLAAKKVVNGDAKYFDIDDYAKEKRNGDLKKQDLYAKTFHKEKNRLKDNQ